MCPVGSCGAYVAGLPHADAVALIREILRAAPEAAVEAVDSAKVARRWGPSESARSDLLVLRALNGTFIREVWVPPGHFGVPDVLLEPTEQELKARGWVLAGRSRG